MTTPVRHCATYDALMAKTRREVAKAQATGKLAEPIEDIPMTYYQDQCYLNAYINQQGCYKGLNLRLKVGSLGLNDWFEYGGKDWQLKDFKKSQTGEYTFDSHCWLEDADGKVYDFVFDWYNEVAKIRTKRPLGMVGVIEGKTKAELEALGLSYVEAPLDAVCYIIARTGKWMKIAYKGLRAGTCKFVALGQKAYLIGDATLGC